MAKLKIQNKPSDSHSSLRDLEGKYAVHLHGTIPIFASGWGFNPPLSYNQTLLALVGVSKFDGNGGIYFSGLTNHGGYLDVRQTVVPSSPNGSYQMSVSEDGRGTILMDAVDQLPALSFEFVMANGWNELFLLLIAPVIDRNLPPFGVPGIVPPLAATGGVLYGFAKKM
jgi:hypothetical protein